MELVGAPSFWKPASVAAMAGACGTFDAVVGVVADFDPPLRPRARPMPPPTRITAARIPAIRGRRGPDPNRGAQPRPDDGGRPPPSLATTIAAGSIPATRAASWSSRPNAAAVGVRA